MGAVTLPKEVALVRRICDMYARTRLTSADIARFGSVEDWRDQHSLTPDLQKHRSPGPERSLDWQLRLGARQAGEELGGPQSTSRSLRTYANKDDEDKVQHP